jgi:hypothetical protein
MVSPYGDVLCGSCSNLWLYFVAVEQLAAEGNFGATLQRRVPIYKRKESLFCLTGKHE